MKRVDFLVTNKFGDFAGTKENAVILTWDGWNDYKYYTLFGIYYLDNSGNKFEIGGVRIAYFGQKEGQDEKGLSINYNFEQIGENFFSLGVSDNYYENLNILGDQIREEVLNGLNDIAFNSILFDQAIKEDVTQNALLRDISIDTVTNQYRRMANGGARLTNYNFTYVFPKDGIKTIPSQIDFNVLAENNPPSNIQIIIGRNGVGKSHLINSMIDSILTSDSNEISLGKFIINNNNNNESFSNLICVTFSAFDEFQFHNKPNKSNVKYHYIGTRNLKNIADSNISLDFADEFTSSLGLISKSSKVSRWKQVIQILESDPIFKDEKCVEFIDNYNSDKIKSIQQKYSRLSSGHKMVLLTITKIVELSIEKSLIFFDEPETHLHPPLLSSFIRALSELLTNRNAVCIMTTHSPIVLQEVPKSSVHVLSRKGSLAKFERLNLETFGENTGILTSEIFGLEVTESGFYKILNDLARTCETYEEAISMINMQLGFEGRSILRSLFFDKMKD